jgi:hypothetical protein
MCMEGHGWTWSDMGGLGWMGEGELVDSDVSLMRHVSGLGCSASS